MSAQKRDFPATSIGRSQGARVQQQHHGQSVASHEAHPLLGATSPSNSPHLSPTSSPSQSATTGTGAKYKPYTPRQRVPPATATTTTVHPPSPSHVGGDTATATSKLQMMHLKAAAQSVGLDTGTLGWVMLERLLDSEVNAGSGEKKEQEEWAEVWSLLTSNKATLLLPLSSHEKIAITPELLRDNIILCDGPGRKNGQFITLSGIRGTLSESSLTLLTTLPRTSKPFSSLLSLTPASSGGSTPTVSQLPPLPPLLPHTTFPHVDLVSYTASLPLPPRNLHPHATQKPPLPPRPGPRPPSSATSSTTAPPSRIPNPFASLFGSKHTPTPSTSSTSSATSTALPIPAPASPPTSLRSLDLAEMPIPPVVVDVQAYTIPHPLRMQDVAREVVKSIDKAVEDGLSEVPAWVKERVLDFTQDLAPFVKSSKPLLPSRNDIEKGEKDKHDHDSYIPNPFSEPPEEIAGRMQDLYVGLEEELRIWVREHDGAGSKSDSVASDEQIDEKGEEEEDMDRREREFMRLEQRVKDVMEKVEKVLCEVFYDRLFMQPTTDDASHDEALSSRIAALNMLDLSLGHLDVKVPASAKDGVSRVVAKCGETLSKLESVHCPAGKAAVLVEAHKIVVDGLSRLSPVQLKPEEEKATSAKIVSTDEFEDDLPTARPFAIAKEVEMEVKDTVIAEAKGESTTVVVSTSSAAESTLLGEGTVVSPVETSLLQAPSSSLIPTRPLSPVGSAPSSPRKSRPATLPLASPATSPMLSAGSLAEDAPSEDKPEESTPVSGDILLPMIIFSVVKANPPHLVSHLLFTQRFRNQSIGGEESYCLINLMAVAEFLENVDLAALGLGDSERVMSTADLTPILLTRSPVTSETPLAPSDANSLRGRMEQQVDAIADSANKVISGVVDSSFGILRSFLPNNTPTAEVAVPAASDANRPGFGLLRRDSGFSIASLAASLPITGRKPQQNGEDKGQQLVTVSRPNSVKSRSRAGSAASALKIHVEGSESESAASGASESGTEDEDEGEDDDEGEESEVVGTDGRSMRSIRSFESMMSASRERRERRAEAASGRTKEKEKDATTKGSGTKPIHVPMTRKSLSDRLAHMSQSALAGFKNSPPGLMLGTSAEPISPISSRPSSPALPALRLAPPIQRFVDCNPEDLRLGEIDELLRDYKRLVEGIKAAKGFAEWD